MHVNRGARAEWEGGRKSAYLVLLSIWWLCAVRSAWRLIRYHFYVTYLGVSFARLRWVAHRVALPVVVVVVWSVGGGWGK